jgi:hypothetical protein
MTCTPSPQQKQGQATTEETVFLTAYPPLLEWR